MKQKKDKLLSMLGIKKNKQDVAPAVAREEPKKETKSVDGSKPVDMLPDCQGDLIKVYQYTEDVCVIRGQGDPLPYVQEAVNRGERQIIFEFEPENKFDSKAIIIKLDGRKIGYVYSGQTQDMMHDFFHNGYDVAAHINTFTVGKITYKIAFYKPKSKCRTFTVSLKNKGFINNTYPGEMLTVRYDDFDERFKLDCGDYECSLPVSAEQYANKYFDVPVEVGEDGESLVFYK